MCAGNASSATGRTRRRWSRTPRSRGEMFRPFRGRHKQYIELAIGVKRDGTITAVDQKVVLDGGAYTSYGVITAYYAGAMLPTLYKIPNYRYDGTRVYTNLPASGAFRGHGVPQPPLAFGWRDKKGKLPRGKGIGVGCGGFVSGAGFPIYRSDFPHSNAVIRVHEDGTGVSLHIAAAEIGQGSDTVMVQIAAEELGVPYQQVWLADCDTVLS